MTKQAERRKSRLSLLSAVATLLVLTGMLIALSACGLADDSPKPDPAGIATGDKKALMQTATDVIAQLKKEGKIT